MQQAVPKDKGLPASSPELGCCCTYFGAVTVHSVRSAYYAL